MRAHERPKASECTRIGRTRPSTRPELRAIGALDESATVSVAIESPGSADPAERANAVETLDSVAERDIVPPALRLQETGEERSPAYERLPLEQALRQSLQDADPRLRKREYAAN